MHFTDALLPAGWAAVTWPAWLAVLVVCLRRAPWRRLAEPVQSHVWCAALVALSLLWSLQAAARPGLSLHLLGATALTLMFGRPLAIIGLSVVLAAVSLNQYLQGLEAWQAYALNALALAVFPVWLTEVLRRFVERHLPPNFFVYIFVAAFFGAALTVIATGMLCSALLWLGGVQPASVLAEEFLPYFILLGFSEAWLNGAAITLMVVYAPRWVGSFDDRRYLS